MDARVPLVAWYDKNTSRVSAMLTPELEWTLISAIVICNDGLDPPNFHLQSNLQLLVEVCQALTVDHTPRHR